MANQEHLEILKQGVENWNEWRKKNRYIKVDLSKTNLTEVDLMNTDLQGADLSKTYIARGDLSSARLIGANLSRSYFNGALLFSANLINTDLTEAHFGGADLSGSNLSYTNLYKADFTGCRVHAISTWNIHLEDTKQLGLVITPQDEPTVTVDSLEVAQFIYLLLNNQKIRDVINTITSKVVLILGCFTPERKVILDTLRDELRKHNYLPILFDFEKPASRDITETISTLAHLSRFVIADITDAKSIPQELMLIVPNLPSVPVQPLILNTQHEYGMFEHFTRYPWVLHTYRYTDEASLLQSLQECIIAPAEQKAKELEKR